MSASQLNSAMKKFESARASAKRAVPATYKIADSYAVFGDERSNDQSLFVHQAVTESDIMNLDVILKGPMQALENQIVGLLTADIGIKDPVAKQITAKQKSEQVKAAIESFTRRVEQQLKVIAQSKYFRKLEDAKQEQLTRMAATEYGASQGTSDQKDQAMSDITNAFDMGPDDIATA